MKNIKEVVVYCNGDSNDLSTWSNVPFFFCKELESRGIKVDRVSFKVDTKTISAKFVRLFSKIKKIYIEKKNNKKTNYKFNKSKYYYSMVDKAIEDGQRKYPNADLDIIFDLSHTVKRDIPYIMIGDWLIDYRLKNRYGRNPLSIEQKLIDKQYEALNKADLVISIFPEATKSIKTKCPNTYYLGHFVNSLEKYEENIKEKYKSNHLLFIGKSKYLKGLERLIKARNAFNKELVIDVIGIDKKEISDERLDLENINFYGYLNKTNKEESKLYYSLIRQAKLMVNLTENWNGVSSLFEAMYHATPILVTPNIELNEMIEDDAKYVLFCDGKDEKEIIDKIKYVFEIDETDYTNISKKAHEYADKYTWDKYVDRFLDLVDKKL